MDDPDGIRRKQIEDAITGAHARAAPACGMLAIMAETRKLNPTKLRACVKGLEEAAELLKSLLTSHPG